MLPTPIQVYFCKSEIMLCNFFKEKAQIQTGKNEEIEIEIKYGKHNGRDENVKYLLELLRQASDQAPLVLNKLNFQGDIQNRTFKSDVDSLLFNSAWRYFEELTQKIKAIKLGKNKIKNFYDKILYDNPHLEKMEKNVDDTLLDLGFSNKIRIQYSLIHQTFSMMEKSQTEEPDLDIMNNRVDMRISAKKEKIINYSEQDIKNYIKKEISSIKSIRIKQRRQYLFKGTQNIALTKVLSLSNESSKSEFLSQFIDNLDIHQNLQQLVFSYYQKFFDITPNQIYESTKEIEIEIKNKKEDTDLMYLEKAKDLIQSIQSIKKIYQMYNTEDYDSLKDRTNQNLGMKCLTLKMLNQKQLGAQSLQENKPILEEESIHKKLKLESTGQKSLIEKNYFIELSGREYIVKEAQNFQKTRLVNFPN